jgi:hypothetical protein
MEVKITRKNIMIYHPYDISENKQMNFKSMSDSVAFSIWKQLNKFDSEVNYFFGDQFYPMNCIPIGLNGYITQVHQMQISKNSHIKPHIDVSDLDTSFISWFAKGNPNGGCFGMF